MIDSMLVNGRCGSFNNNNMMNMIIYTCNISNSCKTNNTILFKLKCIKKSPKI